MLAPTLSEDRYDYPKLRLLPVVFHSCCRFIKKQTIKLVKEYVLIYFESRPFMEYIQLP